MDLKDLGELDFIRALKEGFAESSSARVIRGIGDDTSVTTADADTYQLVTTDSLVQGVHFSLDYFSPASLARKALQTSLSDIAAMGGVPRFFLVSLTLPGTLPTDFTTELYGGFKASSTEYSVELVGGNTTTSKEGIVITTTVLGEVATDEVVYRDGAKVGDRLFVTGTLGDSALGLRFLSDGLGTGGADGAANSTVRDAVECHLNPVPRLGAGRLLAKEGIASSMIDISDGLVIDLSRLMEESATGAVIEFSKLPLCKELTRSSAKFKELALYGGEDYELLFSVPADKVVRLQGIKESFDVPITEIGVVTKLDGGVKVLGPDSKPMVLEVNGYEHFKA
jgi:thiamine-monophosphate kinase